MNETESVARSYLSGVLAGDGSLTSSFRLRVSDRDFADAFAVALRTGYGVEASVTLDRGYWLCRTADRLYRFDDVRYFPCLTEAERGAWLRGFFDSEGNANFVPRPNHGPRSFERRVAFYNTNTITLGRCGVHLTALRLDWLIRERKPTKGHLGDRTVYELALRSSQTGYTRFAQLVGSSIGRKQTKLDAIAASYSPPMTVRAAAMQAAGAETRRARAASGGRY